MLISQSFVQKLVAFAYFVGSYVLALEYDFLIIGGGTSGLVVANRLSELPNITIAVIEAGGEVDNNPNVTNIDNFLKAVGTPIDWQYLSTPQTYAAGRTISYPSGKALGGSSTINGMTYIRAEKSQIDSWETIGNQGWNWESLLPYYKKSEHFDAPTFAQLAAGASYEAADHGFDGPLRVGYPFQMENRSLHDQVQQTWKALGMPHNADANGGNVRGYTVWPATLDRAANVREDASRAYYYTVQNRPNLHLFLNCTVNRITWEYQSESVANGVELTYSNGSTGYLGANKEVIVSAGALRSPAILELSGIGNPSILERHGIPMKISLPGVGENLQDQPNTAIGLAADERLNGTAGYVTYSSISDFLGDLPNPNIESWSLRVSNATNNSIPATALQKLFEVQYGLLKKGVPDAESLIDSGVQLGDGPGSSLGSASFVLMPFSRGNVHISSSNPLSYPLINPNYFLVDFDLDIQVAIGKWTRRFWQTQPISDLTTEISPGFDVLPANATDQEWKTWIKSSFAANCHPLGTAAMMPKELGGVVDNRLRVYGTKNIRVIDASIMPFQVSGHLSSTIYAIAEKAADIIKQDLN